MARKPQVSSSQWETPLPSVTDEQVETAAEQSATVATSTDAGVLPGRVNTLSSIAESAPVTVEPEGVDESDLGDLIVKLEAAATASNTEGRPDISSPMHRAGVMLRELRPMLRQAEAVGPLQVQAIIGLLLKLL